MASNLGVHALSKGGNSCYLNMYMVVTYKNTTVAHGGRDMHMEMVKRTTAILGSEGDRWQQRVV